jgi:hypothetical protein
MEDIELNGWTPIPFVARSFDGNNKKIKINSFNLDARPTSIGLFSTVETDCVLKNINLVLPTDGAGYTAGLSVDLTRYTSMGAEIIVGTLAGQNYGIITNCAVVNENQFNANGNVDYDKTTFDKTTGRGGAKIEVFVGNENLSVRLGGLVGENGVRNGRAGVISNSRVMVDVAVSSYYDQSNTTNEINVNNLTVAGFAATNNGTIVSSYFRDANILNNAKPKAGGTNITAGFVGNNTRSAATGGIAVNIEPTIKASYVMGVASDLHLTEKYVLYGEVMSANGDVGGFVYNNGGLVEDCFISIRITMANAAAAFVYSNAATGVVRNSVANNPLSYAGHYSAFDYLNANNAGIDNCIYVGQRGFADTHERLENLTAAEMLADDAAALATNYAGFSIDKYRADEDPLTVWEITSDGPRPVTADQIAVSVRIVEPLFDNYGRSIINYAPEYSLGSKINPVLITSGDQFNRYIYQGSDAYMQDEDTNTTTDYERNVYQGHMRLVNNISLKNGTELTSLRGVLHTYKTIFKGTLDGNGLSINDISFYTTGTGLRSAGLFSRLEYSTVKNVTLGFTQDGTSAYSIGATTTTYVGGLAGVSVNSNIVDVTLVNRVASNTTIWGRNVVGGLVGMAVVFDTEDAAYNTRIQNIRSAVPVRADLRSGTNYIYNPFESADSYLSLDYTNTGIAGGIIGMITSDPGAFKTRDTDGAYADMDILQKDVNGNVLYGGLFASARGVNVSNIVNHNGASLSVRGEVIGGLVGVVGEDIALERIKYTQSASITLQGKYFVGGLVGANFGTVQNNSSIEITAAPDESCFRRCKRQF